MIQSQAAPAPPFDPDLPGTPDEWWQAALAAAPAWRPAATPMLVLSPHPDDEVLGAGGLMRAHALAGNEVTVLAITDGEAAHRDWQGLDRVRRGELNDALRGLAGGTIDVVHLGVPDGCIAQHSDDVVEAVQALARAGSILVAPYEKDGHPDHDAVGRAAQDSARTLALTLLRYPIWSWHHTTPVAFDAERWVRVPLDAATRAAKARAIECFGSQLDPAGRRPIVPRHVLPYFNRPYEAFLQ